MDQYMTRWPGMEPRTPPAITWETDSLDGERVKDGLTDTRYGVVQGERRFVISHVDDGIWRATDNAVLDGEAGWMCEGRYAACVEWCWNKVVTEGRGP